MLAGCKQTTKFPPSTPIPPDTSPLAIAAAWLAAFESNVASNDTAALAALFLTDSFWRDILALTSQFRTVHSSASIRALLDEHLARAAFHSLGLIAEDRLRAPSIGESVPPAKVRLVQMWFGFETRVGRGS